MFAIGVVWAAFICWSHIQHPEPAEDAMALDSARKNRRQMGLLYGTVGALTVDLEDALKRPGTQIVLVLAGSAAIAGLCFLVARPIEDNEVS